MSVSKEQWKNYLEACNYEPGCFVMGIDKDANTVFFEQCCRDLDKIAAVLTAQEIIPLRVFSPDGKTQLGVDYVPERSKRERVEDYLVRSWPNGGLSCCQIADDILKICEVEEDGE